MEIDDGADMTDWDSLREREAAEPYWGKLRQKLEEERAAGHDVYPPEGEVFAAFDLTPFDKVKVVILGQDPYPNPGEAHGLAFSVRAGVKVPPSLKNVFKELNSDLGIPAPDNGDLTSWARQGVLLLNTALTVRGGARNSHAAWGWSKFTNQVLLELGRRERETVFMLWGRRAQMKRELIDGQHCVIESSHPSPLSARHSFEGSRPFSQANDFLKSTGQEPIDWRLPEA